MECLPFRASNGAHTLALLFGWLPFPHSHRTKVLRHDEFGIEEEVVVQRPAPVEEYAKQNVIVPEIVGKWLRPHQREGVAFVYQCVMGLKDFDGQGCILADGACRGVQANE